MGEYIYASFQCGGKIKREHVEELVNWANHFGLSVDGDGGEIAPDDVAEHWADNQVNYGNLDELIAYCHEHEIDYEYYCAAGPEWDAERRKFVDGALVSFSEGQDGAVVPISDLVKLDALATGWAEFHEKIRLWGRPLPKVEIV